MNLNLSDEQLRDLIGAAVLGALGPEKRDEILTNATKALFDPWYKGGDESVMQRVLRELVCDVAKEHLRVLMDSREFKSKFEATINEAMRRAFDDVHREALVEKMAALIVGAMTSRGW